jgi:hypothetical protein
LLAQTARCRHIIGRSPLAFHTSSAQRGLIQDVIRRLAKLRDLKLAQEIAGADQTNPCIDNRLAFRHIRIFKQQQRFGDRVTAQEPLKRLDRRLFTEPANGSPLFKTPLLVDADVGRYDLHHVEMVIDPIDDPIGARRATDARCFEVNRIGNADRQPRPQQHVQRVSQNQRDQR